MHYTIPSQPSTPLAKTWGSSQSQSSAAWSFGSPSGSIPHGLPSTPRLQSVPLPIGLATPPCSPESQRGTSLHPVLLYDPTGQLMFDVSRSLTHVQFRPGRTASCVHELAMNPSTTRLILNLPGFPNWSFEVANPRGVTVSDVLFKIRECFEHHVPRQEFGTFDQRVQQTTSVTFHRRTQHNKAELEKGLKRMDFFVPNIYFIGLTKAVDGSNRWDIRMTSGFAC